MAKINNPAKGFQFNVLITGINPFTVQDLKNPEYGFELDSHGDTNYKVKTAGMIDVGTLTISKIVNAVGLDNWIWTKVRSMQDSLIGGGLLPSIYKEIIIVQQMAPDNIIPIYTWVWDGCWPFKINGIEFSRMKSENTVHTIEFQIDRLLP